MGNVIALTAHSPKSAQMFCAVFSLISILCYFGAAEGVFAAETHQPFATFNAKVDIDIEDGKIGVLATFTLGAGSNGLDLPKEMITLQLTGGSGAFSVSIPAGSFKARGPERLNSKELSTG